jgi:hypothetical protein
LSLRSLTLGIIKVLKEPKSREGEWGDARQQLPHLTPTTAKPEDPNFGLEGL